MFNYDFYKQAGGGKQKLVQGLANTVAKAVNKGNNVPNLTVRPPAVGSHVGAPIKMNVTGAPGKRTGAAYQPSNTHTGGSAEALYVGNAMPTKLETRISSQAQMTPSPHGTPGGEFLYGTYTQPVPRTPFTLPQVHDMSIAQNPAAMNAMFGGAGDYVINAGRGIVNHVAAHPWAYSAGLGIPAIYGTGAYIANNHGLYATPAAPVPAAQPVAPQNSNMPIDPAYQNLFNAAFPDTASQNNGLGIQVYNNGAPPALAFQTTPEDPIQQRLLNAAFPSDDDADNGLGVRVYNNGAPSLLNLNPEATSVNNILPGAAGAIGSQYPDILGDPSTLTSLNVTNPAANPTAPFTVPDLTGQVDPYANFLDVHPVAISPDVQQILDTDYNQLYPELFEETTDQQQNQDPPQTPETPWYSSALNWMKQNPGYTAGIAGLGALGLGALAYNSGKKKKRRRYEDD